MLKLNVLSDQGDVLRVECAGEISQAHFLAEQDPLGQLGIPAVFRKRVLMDLQRVVFVDSSGIGWLLESHRKFQSAGGELVLHSVPDLVRKTLVFCGVHKILHLAGDAPDARKLAAGSN